MSEETSFVDWRKRERARANDDPAERRSSKGIVLAVILVAVVALAAVAVFLIR
ncbi:hypothetical protein [Gandjariella thermophila]|uniref:Uncharacterized protein n=1 Tax=Gandjariella thermophila TaxID=1931992 RepID=A0A4D4J5D4_9PSEU|nr:hypothetical protein [Gandjariella thermophila]GDY30674.1 hypothetical protein GTS_23070 [Gandjariella thermophila]